MKENTKKTCNCNDECTCKTETNECTCGDDCKCETNECTCSEECNCNDDIKNCDCDKENCCCECDCDNEKKEDITKKKEKKRLFKKNDDKVKELEAKIKDLENKLLMQSADSINYRKRKDEEVARLLKFSNQDIVKDLLPVADNFERSLTLAEDNENEEFNKFIEGYKMIYCSIQNILDKYDVKAIDGANKPFDPVYHNAVMMEAKDGIEPGMVLEVLQKGYLYKDKVIRPAMVKVSE